MAEKKVETKKKISVTPATYDILRRPLISEKTAKLSENGAVAFEVAPKATKADVIHAVNAIYGVKPVKVNIVVVKGKVKSFRGRGKGAQRKIKKAYVSLPLNAKLDLGAKI